MFGLSLGRLLIAGALLSLVGLGLFPALQKETATISVVAPTQTPVIHESFSIQLTLTAKEPVNVFAGTLVFNPTQIAIESIDYNTSVADLWAEEPWYSNGEGTLTFAGGITQSGGFSGTENIIQITFKPLVPGETVLTMKDIRILKHDGLGTDALVLTPLDTILSVTTDTPAVQTRSRSSDTVETDLHILPSEISTDLNGDGRHTIADVSIFMTHLIAQNLRSDFNRDGVVNLHDLSILNKKQ